MVQSVLGSLILGYRPLWNRARKLAAIQLYVHSEASALVDTAHLLRTLQELWSASSPPIRLSPQRHQLLSNMLEHAPRGRIAPGIVGDDDLETIGRKILREQRPQAPIKRVRALVRRNYDRHF